MTCLFSKNLFNAKNSELARESCESILLKRSDYPDIHKNCTDLVIRNLIPMKVARLPDILPSLAKKLDTKFVFC